MSESESYFHDWLQDCIRNTKLPAEKARKAKRMMRSAQKLLKESYGSTDECYNFCFVSNLMDIVEYLTKNDKQRRRKTR